MSIGRTLLIASLLAACGPLAAQDVAYRWVDENGVTHFSDQPPSRDTTVREIPIPDYKPPAGPAFSYVAMLRRLEALEREFEEANRARDARPTPAPVVVRPTRTVERVAVPAFFPHRPGVRPFPPQPDRPARQTPSDRFDRLVEGTRDRYEPPGN